MPIPVAQNAYEVPVAKDDAPGPRSTANPMVGRCPVVFYHPSGSTGRLLPIHRYSVLRTAFVVPTWLLAKRVCVIFFQRAQFVIGRVLASTRSPYFYS